MQFIDTHCHVTDEAFEGDVQGYVERALAAGVSKMLQADISSAERGPMLAAVDAHPGVLFAMAGLYPGCVESNYVQELELAFQAARRPGIIAIGEIGLDYHFSIEFKEQQKEALKAQLELAAKLNLPVNIHLRDATQDFIDIIESCRGLGLRGNLHAFSGSAQTFKRLCKSGDWYVGIGGVLTFKKASIATEVEDIPLERILLETDAPYLAPTPLRGSRNESANIPLIADKLAQIKGCSLEQVAQITTHNACTLFNI